MTVSSGSKPAPGSTPSVGDRGAQGADGLPDRQLLHWGGVAGLTGVVCMVGAGAVVGILDLPDASDVETLTDFADIETGRIVEHLLYLGAVVLFALHALVLHRSLRAAHPAAALFGTATAVIGYGVMAASSLLHVSTSPLSDLYTSPGTSAEDLRAIEYAWHGAQSVFDTMLATGVLLVAIGIVLLGVAMWRSPDFGHGLARAAIGLGTVGVIGALVAVVDPGSMWSAMAVLAITAFHLVTGWRTLVLGRAPVAEPAGDRPSTER